MMFRVLPVETLVKQKGLPGGRPSKKVARLAGFEPTTPWFVAKYSIQLSYSRTQK